MKSQKMKLNGIRGIGLIFSEKLNKLEIYTDEDLLVHGATKFSREEIAQETGIKEIRIFSWVNMTDFLRIKGINPEFALLLHITGVKTIGDLGTRQAENLHRKLTETKATKKTIKTIPTLDQIDDYIKQAKDLEPVVSY